ncbi:MAG: NfeD family protein [Lachnospiraceae bacterium]|jgi:membrane protein implicated in regulation of membrane protease activity|nr:NfeD family protein [Lachnospiraceae bacterium]
MGILGWLIAFVVFLGIEAATFALTTIWFAGGSLVGLVLCILGAGKRIQLVAFVIVSFGLLFLTRPLALQFINRRTKKTNVEEIAGQQARITEEVDNEAGTGAAVLNGQTWTARAARGGEKIPAGTMVTINSVQGVKLMVEVSEQK